MVENEKDIRSYVKFLSYTLKIVETMNKGNRRNFWRYGVVQA